MRCLSAEKKDLLKKKITLKSLLISFRVQKFAYQWNERNTYVSKQIVAGSRVSLSLKEAQSIMTNVTYTNWRL